MKSADNIDEIGEINWASRIDFDTVDKEGTEEMSGDNHNCITSLMPVSCFSILLV